MGVGGDCARLPSGSAWTSLVEETLVDANLGTSMPKLLRRSKGETIGRVEVDRERRPRYTKEQRPQKGRRAREIRQKRTPGRLLGS